MARFGGIHTIHITPETDQKRFETFMLSEAFPTAAEVPGSFSRSGQSAIQSQHLLRLAGNSRTYFWLIKASGVFDMPLFTRVFHDMYGVIHDKLNSFGTCTSSMTFAVAGSYAAGPRFLSEKPVGAPHCSNEV